MEKNEDEWPFKRSLLDYSTREQEVVAAQHFPEGPLVPNNLLKDLIRQEWRTPEFPMALKVDTGPFLKEANEDLRKLGFPQGLRDYFCEVNFLKYEFTSHHRKILIDWMMLYSQSKELSRKCFALASRYVDIFLHTKQKVVPKDGQLIAAAALRIAALKTYEQEKIHENSFLKNYAKADLRNFDEELRSFISGDEGDYASWLEVFTTQWDQKKDHRYADTKYRLDQQDSQSRYFLLCSLADAINLEDSSYSYSRFQLIQSLFAIITYKECKKKSLLQINKGLSKLATKNFFKFFNSFMVSCGFPALNLKEDVLKHIQHFFRLVQTRTPALTYALNPRGKLTHEEFLDIQMHFPIIMEYINEKFYEPPIKK